MTASPRRLKLLVLAWGDSIHARRRIQVFVDDPSFDVAVVSNYDYAIAGARNYLLARAEPLAGMARQRLAKAEKGHLRDGLETAVDTAVAARDLFTLRRAVAEVAPDVVLLQTLLYPCYLAFALPKSLPLVITFWNGDVLWWAQWNGIERLLKKQIVTYGVRRAAAITVNSDLARAACLSYGGDARRIHLIRYPGIDRERFFPNARDDARRALGIDARHVVLSPRGLGEYLNTDVIVAAIAAVTKRYPDALFVFVSGAAGEAEVARHQAMAERLGVSAHCRWERHIAWERMPLYYNAADVMVSISSKDSLPNCMLEAMACGIPVIMGDLPAIREWVVDRENGFLIDSRDPAALAERICAVFQQAQMVRSWGETNLELVRDKADGRRNNEQLKSLLRTVARAT